MQSHQRRQSPLPQSRRGTRLRTAGKLSMTRMDGVRYVRDGLEGTAEMKLAIVLQVAALVLAGAAVVWGGCMVYVALYPGPSGEFGGYSVFFAAIVDVPVGVVTLGVALAVRKGKSALRWACLVLSIAALALPFVTRAAWQSHFIPLK